jgi:undecaprenyl diphosphate synthase
VVEAAPELGIDLLTLYAFSSDNWRRPQPEVANLMELFEKFLTSAREDCVKQGVRITVLGRRDRVPRSVSGAISGMEEATRAGKGLHVRLAVDYSARDAILDAARRFHCPNGDGREVFARCLGHAIHAGEAARDVDLLIRTGGDQRLSDFLLWECSYAELYFTQKMWPEFTADDLREAVQDFHGRDRRYGCAKTFLPAGK